MKWYNSFKYKPKHGTHIFIWDLLSQKQILLNAFWDPEKWKPNAKFPFWSYVLDEFEPIDLQPERLNPEDARNSVCDSLNTMET